jgi:hypothetical protein
LWLVEHGPTIFPSPFRIYSQKAEGIVSVLLCQRLAASNPIRQMLATYLHIAGIETGYGYFAPNVPGSYKLVFELHYSDGRVEYELPSVSSAAAGLRVAGLLDKIGRTPYDALREHLIKTLAQSVWRQHPEVKTIRAVFGSTRLPNVDEFERGKRESYDFLYAYDSLFLGFWRRALQLHLCAIYFFSGLTKCLGSGWWDGSNVWRALIRPPFNIIDPEMLVGWKYLFPVAGIFICLLEIGYPFFIWSDKTRKMWLICICAMHSGIGLLMGMYLFALIMIVLNVAAFGPGLVRSQRESTSLRLQEVLT